MRFIRKLSIVLCALTLGLPGAVAAGQFNAVINLGDPMPAFENLPAVDGSELSSADLAASVVVLVSLANHCPWVKGMDRGLVELAEQFDDRDVRIVGFAVNRREDDRLPAMQVHAREAGYNFTYVYDESQQLGRDLGATRTPEYFVFDAHRKLVYMGLLTNSPARLTRSGDISHIDGEPVDFYVADAIEATLAGQPVDPAETRAHGCSVEYD